MEAKLSNKVGAFIILTALLVPLPTRALGGSNQFWLIIFSFSIASALLVLAILPWLTYHAIKNGRTFWIVVTIVFCAIGIYYSTFICGEVFGNKEWLGQRILTNLFASSPYCAILLLTCQKALEKREDTEIVQPNTIHGAFDYLNNEHLQVAPNRKEEFLTYQIFSSEAEANALAGLLKKNNIDFLIEDHSPSFDIIFSTNVHDKELWVKLKKADFEAADGIYSEYLDSFTESIDKEYHLFTFSD